MKLIDANGVFRTGKGNVRYERIAEDAPELHKITLPKAKEFVEARLSQADEINESLGFLLKRFIEMCLEVERIGNYPCKPCRMKCIYLTDEASSKQWLKPFDEVLEPEERKLLKRYTLKLCDGAKTHEGFEKWVVDYSRWVEVDMHNLGLKFVSVKEIQQNVVNYWDGVKFNGGVSEVLCEGGVEKISVVAV